MTNEQNNIIVACVIKNVDFSYFESNGFTIQELLNGRLSLSSLRKMGTMIEKRLNTETSSRFSTARKTSAQKTDELRADAIELVIADIQAKAAAKAELEKVLEKIAMLEGLHAKAEMDALGEKGATDLLKMIAELKAKL